MPGLSRSHRPSIPPTDSLQKEPAHDSINWRNSASHSFSRGDLRQHRLEPVVLLLEWLFGDPFITHFALVPIDILHGQNLITLLTSMFLHKGLLQLSGKMRYLRIFGPNLEDVTARSAS